jgi:hypothetical protein
LPASTMPPATGQPAMLATIALQCARSVYVQPTTPALASTAGVGQAPRRLPGPV